MGGVEGIGPTEIDSETGEIRKSLRGWSKFSMEVAEDTSVEWEYDQLISQEIFRGRTALDKVQFRIVDEDNPSHQIVNGVYSYGKLVGYGTSVGLHFLTIDSVIAAYARVINRIEEEFAIGWVRTSTGHVLKGEPFIVHFPPSIEIVNLTAFAESLFRSVKPFRLFGIPHSSSNDRIDIEAIDLHTGDPLSVELTSEWMRIYLPRGSCGNIIARLFTNLQHSLSSDVRLSVGDNFDPFDTMPR